MNLFEKIAKENKDNSTLVNVGLGATTLGGLGAAGYGAYFTNKDKRRLSRTNQRLEGTINELNAINNQTKGLYQGTKGLFANEQELQKALSTGKADGSIIGAITGKNKTKQHIVNEIKQLDELANKKAVNAAKYQNVAKKLQDLIKINKRIGGLGLAAAGLGAVELQHNN
jgi:hypothetical protein